MILLHARRSAPKAWTTAVWIDGQVARQVHAKDSKIAIRSCFHEVFVQAILFVEKFCKSPF
jgi:hypothetical protein